MRRDEVDARIRTPAALLVKIAAAGESRRELRDDAAVTAPEPAHRIAVLAVPFGPFRRKISDLIATFPEIPRFRNQLHLRQHGILMDDVEERPKLIDRMQLTSQCARQIEAEPVHVHFNDPVPQAVHDELQDARTPHVQRVPAPGEVLIEPWLVRQQAVIRRVVDSAQRQRRSGMVAFPRVVVDNVEDDLEVRGVQRADHHLELAHRVLRRQRRGVTHVGREVRQRVVAPVIRQSAFDEMPVIEMLVNGHQLDGRHAKGCQVTDGRLGREAEIRAPQRLRNVRVEFRESFDVKLVDERVMPGRAQRPVLTPRKCAVDHRRQGGERRAVAVVEGRVLVSELEAEQRLVPLRRAPDDFGVRIHHELVRVEAVARVWRKRAVYPIPIELSRADVGQIAMPHHVGVFNQRNRKGTTRPAWRVRKISRNSRRRRPTSPPADKESQAIRACSLLTQKELGNTFAPEVAIKLDSLTAAPS